MILQFSFIASYLVGQAACAPSSVELLAEASQASSLRSIESDLEQFQQIHQQPHVRKVLETRLNGKIVERVDVEERKMRQREFILRNAIAKAITLPPACGANGAPTIH